MNAVKIHTDSHLVSDQLAYLFINTPTREPLECVKHVFTGWMPFVTAVAQHWRRNEEQGSGRGNQLTQDQE